MKYPTNWTIDNLFHNYSISYNGVYEIPPTKENQIVVRWTRYIAPYHVETKVTLIQLKPLQGKLYISNR